MTSPFFSNLITLVLCAIVAYLLMKVWRLEESVHTQHAAQRRMRAAPPPPPPRRQAQDENMQCDDYDRSLQEMMMLASLQQWDLT